MAEQVTKKEEKKQGFLIRFAKVIERVGNKLPHPVYLFLYMIIAVYIISLIGSWLGWGLKYDAMARQADGTFKLMPQSIVVTNLFSAKQLGIFFSDMVKTYGTNVVLLPLLIITFAVSVCEDSGFFEAVLKKFLLNMPNFLVTYVLCIAGICANIMSDVGMVLVPTLGAVIFKALGRNPWIGIAAGYASSAAGFTANLFPGNTDVLISGITNGVSKTFGYEVSAMCNYYFLCSATLVLALVVTIVTETFVKHLYGDCETQGDLSILNSYRTTDAQNHGLRMAGIGFLVVLVIVLIGAIPTHGFFRNPKGLLLPTSPLMSSIPSLMFVIFLVLGCCYGLGAKTITKKQIPLMMQQGVNKMAGLVLILFPATMFADAFNRSGLSTLISVLGERFLRSINMTGFSMMVIFVIVVSILNLFMYSGSTKWMILAPIFVPMFNNLGIKPEMTQLLYRLGDSSTNNLTPLNAALLTSVALMIQYRIPDLNKEEPGVGTVLSAQFPFSLVFLFGFLAWFAVFYYFNLPLGIV